MKHAIIFILSLLSICAFAQEKEKADSQKIRKNETAYLADLVWLDGFVDGVQQHFILDHGNDASLPVQGKEFVLTASNLTILNDKKRTGLAGRMIRNSQTSPLLAYLSFKNHVGLEDLKGSESATYKLRAKRKSEKTGRASLDEVKEILNELKRIREAFDGKKFEDDVLALDLEIAQSIIIECRAFLRMRLQDLQGLEEKDKKEFDSEMDEIKSIDKVLLECRIESAKLRLDFYQHLGMTLLVPYLDTENPFGGDASPRITTRDQLKDAVTMLKKDLEGK